MKDRYYANIKEYLINNEIYKRVKDYSKNRNDLTTYYNVGKELSDAGKHYGDGIIKDYSKCLTIDLGKGYSKRNLWLMLQFYLLSEKMQTLSAQLTWSHYVELLSIENIEEIKYYISITEKQNLTIRQLRDKIKNNEYARLSIETRTKLNNKEQLEVKDTIPNPIMIRNKNDVDVINEKILKRLILEDIDNFLLELGNNFSYIGNEYKIKIGDRYNYIDLLLYNIEFNCYVVVELKVTELKKEHIGQIGIYMNYIDSSLKKIDQDKTIGIIICKKNNQFVMEYCSDSRILSREYKLNVL
jgi:predicted nuclease of restriction endonuclease-like (RecB) superfamily